MKMLMIGDVVGSPGRKIFAREVKRLKAGREIDACIVNAENAAAGSGITSALAKELFEAGADAITLGDHTWGQKEFAGQIEEVKNLVRPCNFAKECPGKGWTLVTMPTFRFAVVNVMGRTFMAPCDCPFRSTEKALNEIPKDYVRPLCRRKGDSYLRHAYACADIGCDDSSQWHGISDGFGHDGPICEQYRAEAGAGDQAVSDRHAWPV